MLLHGDLFRTIIVEERRNLTMTNLRNTCSVSVKISAAIAACLTFSACGNIAEKVTEEGAERIIEAESGEDVDIDFDSDDGSFSVQTEDGSFSIGDDGSFVVTDQDGSVLTGNANDDGFVVTDQDGEQVLSVDEDNGEISIQGEDGEDVYRVVTEVPDEWPSDIPRPEALTVEAGSYASADGDTLMTLIGTPDEGDAVAYAENYASALLAAGMTETGRFDSSSDGNTTAQRSYENEQWMVSVSSYVDDATNSISISLVSNSN